MSSTFVAVTTDVEVTLKVTAECVSFLLDNEFISVKHVMDESGWNCLSVSICIFIRGDDVLINPLAGRATFLSLTVHGRSDNIVVWP